MDSFVFIFVGRINKDKGILDLTKEAFEKLHLENFSPHLIFVGEFEDLKKRICIFKS